MKTYRYQEQKLQTYRWLPQAYAGYLWQAAVKEELPDEGKYTAHSDLEEPDSERDSREGHPGAGESEADESDSREGDDLTHPDGKRRKGRSRGKDHQ
jgi:hypothetical protein